MPNSKKATNLQEVFLRYALLLLFPKFFTELFSYLLIYLLLTNLLTYLLTSLLTYSIDNSPSKLTGYQLANKFPYFMEYKISSPHSHVSTNCPYTRPYQSSQCSPSLFPKIQLNIMIPSTAESYKFSRTSVFPPKTLYAPLLSPSSLHSPPISFFSI